jgi:hypothetical protein
MINFKEQIGSKLVITGIPTPGHTVITLNTFPHNEGDEDGINFHYKLINRLASLLMDEYDVCIMDIKTGEFNLVEEDLKELRAH